MSEMCIYTSCKSLDYAIKITLTPYIIEKKHVQ